MCALAASAKGELREGERVVKFSFIGKMIVVLVVLGCGCARQPESVFSIGKDNLVHIRLSNGNHSVSVNTRASVFQRYSVCAVSNNFVCLTSSDIGTRAYELDAKGDVHEFPSLCVSNRFGSFYVIYNPIVRGGESCMDRAAEGVRVAVDVRGRVICGVIPGRFRYSVDSLIKDGETDIVIRGIDGDVRIKVNGSQDGAIAFDFSCVAYPTHLHLPSRSSFSGHSLLRAH